MNDMTGTRFPLINITEAIQSKILIWNVTVSGGSSFSGGYSHCAENKICENKKRQNLYLKIGLQLAFLKQDEEADMLVSF